MQRTDYTAVGETLYSAVLPNGLSIYVVPKPGYRRSFAVFAANYGGADRRFTLGGRTLDTPAGVAHYLEHKMFDTEEGDALMKMSATGADPNAFTSQAMTAYHFECTDAFAENLRTLLSFVSVPWFTRESVDKERGIIAQEIRMYEDSPDDVVYMNLMKSLFRENPLRDSVAGTVESIAQITPELLYDCHRTFYRPSNMALCVVGNADPSMVEQIAGELLSPERSEIPGRDYGQSEGREPVRPLTKAYMPVSAPIFAIGEKLGPVPAPAESQLYRMTAGLALRCLCGRSSPFYLKHYDGGLLNATFGCDVDFSAGQTVISFEGETAKEPEAVLSALREEILRVHRQGFDPALFDRQKKASLGGRIRGLTNFRGLAVGLAEGCFAGFQPLDAFGRIGSITCADADRWVRENLDPERFAMSVVYPGEEA